jgi:glycosyltransferase involved in cell wall biosynthesis
MSVANLRASVVIPTYNRNQLLTYTLDSLLEQTVGIEAFEVIVVDDGSSDDTPGVVERYRSRLNVKYLFQEDLGFRAAAARNLGIRAAAAPICVFIDTGVIAGPRLIAEHLRSHHASQAPRAVIGYVYGYDLYNGQRDELSTLITPADPEGSLAVLKARGVKDDREPSYVKHGDDLSTWPAPWLVFWTCNVSVRTEILHRAGLFDESYTTWGGEDTDLALALHAQDVGFVLNRAIEAIHYPHDREFFGNSAVGMAGYERKRRYMYEKYRSNVLALWAIKQYPDFNETLLELARGSDRPLERTRASTEENAARALAGISIRGNGDGTEPP